MRTYTYDTKLSWTGQLQGTAEVADKPILNLSAPTEFKGTKGAWTPEDLLTEALESCLMMTYMHLCQDEGFAVTSYTSKARAVVAKGPRGFEFSRIEVYPDVEVPQDAERAAKILDRAHELCLVRRSLACAVEIFPAVRERAADGHCLSRAATKS